MRATDPAPRVAEDRIAGIELVACGAVKVPDGGEPPVERRDAPGPLDPVPTVSAPFGEGREVEGDEARVGRE
jgi:hypothetical protein